MISRDVETARRLLACDQGDDFCHAAWPSVERIIADVARLHKALTKAREFIASYRPFDETDDALAQIDRALAGKEPIGPRRIADAIAARRPAP